MMRGFFFSMDTILAFMIALLFIGAIFTAISSIPAASDDYSYLRRIVDDSLVVMEKRGILENSIRANSSQPIREFAAILPNNLCYRISIAKPPAITPILAQENCLCQSFTIGRRSVVVADSTSVEYLAEMRACLK
jgi:hypothetical protein